MPVSASWMPRLERCHSAHSDSKRACATPCHSLCSGATWAASCDSVDSMFAAPALSCAPIDWSCSGVTTRLATVICLRFGLAPECFPRALTGETVLVNAQRGAGAARRQLAAVQLAHHGREARAPALGLEPHAHRAEERVQEVTGADRPEVVAHAQRDRHPQAR